MIVIGAGIGGLACAVGLHLNGVRVQLLEKSRGVGGRMSTRREAPWSFDHGAPLLQAHSERLRNQLLAFESAGRLERYYASWIGVPGMNAFARSFVDDLPDTPHGPLTPTLGATVHSISRSDGRWRATLDDGNTYDADVIVLAVPAPQAVAILQRRSLTGEGNAETSAEAHLPTQVDTTVDPIASAVQRTCDALRAVYMTPCWSVMLALRDDVPDSTLDGSLLPSIGDTEMRTYAQHTRPGRSRRPAFVLHTSAAWTISRLEQLPSDIEAIVRNAIAHDQPTWEIEHLRAHRWRYAQVTRGLPNDFLWHTDATLGACGDWARVNDADANGIERAIASGRALARQILSYLAVGPASRIATK